MKVPASTTGFGWVFLPVSCKKGNDGKKLWDPEEGKDELALQSQVD